MTEPNPLITQLTSDLKPVRSMAVRPLIAGVVIGIVLAVIYVATVLGIRPEIMALMHGHWPEVAMVVGKPLLFLLTGISALWAMNGIYRPEGVLKTHRLWPVLGLLGLVLLGIVIEGATLGMAEVVTRMRDPFITCWTTIFGGGLAGLAVLWALWLRRAASSYPAVFGALSGLMCASFMASAYALHCDRDAPIYILTFYGLAVAAFSGLAGLFGGKFLRW
jgi:hypothetical protein